MSSFLRKGKRQLAKKKKKEVKYHTKEFYKILGELDRVADILLEDKEVTEANLKEKAQELTELEISNLEFFILKGKLGFYETLQEEVSKAYEPKE